MTQAASVTDFVKTVRDAFEDQQQATWKTLTQELDPSVQTTTNELLATIGVVAKPLVCREGQLIDKAACNFTHSRGDSLPPAASARNPQLAGKPFSASALSVIVHPYHPRIPTVHMNVRFFYVEHGDGHWHFGGGMDLTPYFLGLEDATTWHAHARQACVDEAQYRQFKQQCDDYFYLPHREEGRGIGGLFFDDLNEPDFETCFGIAVRVCEQFRAAYSTIFNHRKSDLWCATDENWMLHRRGRYAEFNLIYDRGTRYGLQSGRRVESVLASMPPRASWTYEHEAETDEQRELMNCLRNPRDWL